MREALKEAETPWPMRKYRQAVLLSKTVKSLDVATTRRGIAASGHYACGGWRSKQANQHEESWRLLDTTLFVTIEPCVMCSGAILGWPDPQVSTYDQSEVRWRIYDITDEFRAGQKQNRNLGRNKCAAICVDLFPRNEKQAAFPAAKAETQE